MSNKGNIVLKSGIWYTISNFFLRGIGLITTPIFTRLLTQEDFGAFSNYTSWIAILTVIVTLNVEATLISARYEHEKKLDEYISSILGLSMISTCIWWGISNIFMDKASNLLEMNPVYVNSIFIYLLTLPAINLFQSRERFFFRYKMSVALSMLLSIGTSLVSVLLVITLDNRLNGRIMGMIIPNIIIGVSLMIYFFIKGKRVNFSYWSEALKIVLPFIPHLLSLNVLNLMDRVMITKFCGEKYTALYSLPYTVASIITMILSSLNGAFSPWLGGKLAEKKYKDIRSVSKWYILLFLYFAVAVMLIAPEVLLILGGQAYIEAKWVMVPVAMGCVCQFIYTLFVNVEQFEKKTIGMAFASMSAAVLNFVLNFLLIPRFGYIAASFTTLIGYIWLLVVHMYIVYRMKMNHIYSYRFVGFIIVITCLLGGLVYLLYLAHFLRYITIGIYVILSLVIIMQFREKIFIILKGK